MARLKIFEGGKLHREYTLDPRRSLVIGADPECDLVLPGENVAGRHCRVWFEGGDWWVEDLGSPIGTTINAKHIEEPRALHDGDQVQAGSQALLLETGTVALELEPRDDWCRGFSEERDRRGLGIYSNRTTPTKELPRHRRSWVLVCESPRPKALVLDKDLILIGRGEHCDLQIDGLLVRPEQAAVVLDQTGCRIIGRGGWRRVWVNGERVDEAYLAPGDEIVIAGTRLILKQL